MKKAGAIDAEQFLSEIPGEILTGLHGMQIVQTERILLFSGTEGALCTIKVSIGFKFNGTAEGAPLPGGVVFSFIICNTAAGRGFQSIKHGTQERNQCTFPPAVWFADDMDW